MSYEKDYKSKLTTPDKAVELIAKQGNISFAMAVGQPPALLQAVADRARRGGFAKIRVYYLHAEEPANQTILNYDLMDIIEPHPGFLGAKERELVQQSKKEGRKVIYYVPNSFSQMPRYFRENIELDTFLATVSPMDKAGYFSLGTNNDYSSTAARHCKKLIVEVNKNMPRVFGSSPIHISEVAAVVENTVPMIEMPPREPKPEDEAIGKQIANLIPNGATIQMGVGGVPNAVCRYLQKHNDLGIHSELLSLGMVDLIKSGVVTGKCKKNHIRKHVFTISFGTNALYEFINNNPACESYSVDYVNDPYVIGQNDNVISINGILEIDLFGQVNAEYIGEHQFGGPGGQNDFVRGAYLSKGGKSFVAFESTTKRGTISKIVPKIDGVVTNLRIDTQFVVTEYGIVNLKGLSSTERALKLIELAHPKFRDQLRDQAKVLHLI